jgi:hypothetical protein
LYFLHIPSITVLNTAIFLWKAQISHAGRAFR